MLIHPDANKELSQENFDIVRKKMIDAGIADAIEFEVIKMDRSEIDKMKAFVAPWATAIEFWDPDNVYFVPETRDTQGLFVTSLMKNQRSKK